MEWVELNCAGCDRVFPRPVKEYRRLISKGKIRFFCGVSCQVGFTNMERYGDPLILSERKTLISLICANCSGPLLKETREVNRWKKQGRNYFFCSPSCSTSHRNKLQPKPQNLTRGGAIDDLSPFRWFMLRARSRKQHEPTDLNHIYIKDLWEKQNGICSITGWQLILPKDTGGWQESSPRNASIDRIENDRGYVQGNVRFIALIANLARGQFSDVELREFCKAVVKFTHVQPL